MESYGIPTEIIMIGSFFWGGHGGGPQQACPDPVPSPRGPGTPGGPVRGRGEEKEHIKQ